MLDDGPMKRTGGESCKGTIHARGLPAGASRVTQRGIPEPASRSAARLWRVRCNGRPLGLDVRAGVGVRFFVSLGVQSL